MQSNLPMIHLNYLAVVGAAVACFVFGWLWYGPLFGKLWARLMGMPADVKPTSAQMARGMILSLVGALLMSFVLAHSVQVWQPSRWNAGANGALWMYGFFAGLFTWIGFYIPQLFSALSWEGKSPKLFFLNAIYHFINLQIAGQVLANWS